MTEDALYSFSTGEGHQFSGVGKVLHSVDDKPAVIYADGTKWWYRNGKIHRDNGPAVVWANGTEEWFQDGTRHRVGGPAIIYPESGLIVPEYRGARQFWENGQLIREELPPSLAAYRNELVALRRKHGLA